MSNFNKLTRFIMISISIIILLNNGCSQKKEIFTNSIEMDFVLIQEGSFIMGESREFDAGKFGAPDYLIHGDYDEHPLYKVTISKPFYMSVSEVTVEQFQKYRPGYIGVEEYHPYVYIRIKFHKKRLIFCYL